MRGVWFSGSKSGVSEKQAGIFRNVNKATAGYDGISAKILKAGAEEIYLPLSTLYNSCIKKEQWPYDCKNEDWTVIAFERSESVY